MCERSSNLLRDGGDHGVRRSGRRVSLGTKVVRRNKSRRSQMVGRRGLFIIPATGGGVRSLKRTTGLVASKKAKPTITETQAETGDRGVRFQVRRTHPPLVDGCTHHTHPLKAAPSRQSPTTAAACPQSNAKQPPQATSMSETRPSTHAATSQCEERATEPNR